MDDARKTPRLAAKEREKVVIDVVKKAIELLEPLEEHERKRIVRTLQAFANISTNPTHGVHEPDDDCG